MKWYQWFIAFVAWSAIVFVAGHFIWPATNRVEIPGKVVLDSAATVALTLRLDSVRAELIRVHAKAARDQRALREARNLYEDLAGRLDSIEHTSGDTIDVKDWPAAAYDTTLARTMRVEVTIGDSVEKRDVTQEIRLQGEHVLPPFNVFRGVSVSVTPSAVYFSRQLPGKTVQTVEVIRWPWLPVVAGYLGGTIVTTLIALLIAGASY